MSWEIPYKSHLNPVYIYNAWYPSQIPYIIHYIHQKSPLNPVYPPQIPYIIHYIHHNFPYINLYNLVGGLEHFLFFPYIGNNHPKWRAHILQRGRYTTNKIISSILFHVFFIIHYISYISINPFPCSYKTPPKTKPRFSREFPHSIGTIEMECLILMGDGII